jgi:hypothetical protein
LVGEEDDDADETDDNALNDFEDIFTRLVVVVPPFLANWWVDNNIRDPMELLLEAQAAISAFDTLHQGNPNMPTASTSTRHILQFLWAAIHKKLNGVPLLVTTEPVFEAWRFHLHSTSISPSKNANSPSSGWSTGCNDAVDCFQPV